MIALLLAALAFGQECSLDLPTVRSDTSMAWVSRTGDHARGGEYLWVTPTGELSAWIGRQDRATLGGLLRHLGLRRRKSEPKRHYKVVVFDATHASLCRPIEGEAPGAEISGVVTCETNLSRSNRQHDGCGRSRDPNGNGAVLFRATWRDLSANGFCVLPANRFIEEAR